MQTLHFDAAGNYTGYSTNKSSLLEMVISGFTTFASVVGAGVTIFGAATQIKQLNDVRKAKKAAENNSNSEFEDPE